ncbi:MAG TPA: hypothetical protein VJX47_08080 [Candidatus Sulfotelmatobacter sp.]|nr:hypothetical protein [Candidatus Sulfotelmatobacter sp.]
MKRTNILAALLVALSLISTGCGTSDYVQSVQLTATGASSGGFFNLAGVDGTLQLVANAVYHSGKTVPITSSVTFSITPTGTDDNGNALPPYGPTTVPINSSGLMTGIVPICTWTDAMETTGSGSSATTAPANPPVWEYTGYYQVTATYRGLTSQPVGIGVGVAASNNSPVGGCGPS